MVQNSGHIFTISLQLFQLTVSGGNFVASYTLITIKDGVMTLPSGYFCKEVWSQNVSVDPNNINPDVVRNYKAIDDKQPAYIMLQGEETAAQLFQILP